VTAASTLLALQLEHMGLGGYAPDWSVAGSTSNTTASMVLPARHP
jgi:hypothetical protein